MALYDSVVQHGHDEANDDLFGAPPAPGSSGSFQYPQDPGQFNPSGLGPAYDQDVHRARLMGSQGQARRPVQLQTAQADEARGIQMGGLASMLQAAQGGAPSRAALMGQQATAGAIQQGTRSMAGARGPAASVAAYRSAAQGTGAQAGAIGQDVTNARQGEVQRDTLGYLKGGLGMRAGDLDQATAQARLEAQQRALNEERQENFERRAFDTRKQQQLAALRYQANNEAEALGKKKQVDAYNALEDQRFTNGLSAGTGGGYSALGRIASDSRTKMRIGSLSGLRKFMSR